MPQAQHADLGRTWDHWIDVVGSSSILRLRSKAFITLCVFFTLRSLLRPTQMKCTCNGNDSIYITLSFINKIKYVLPHVLQ